MTFKDGRYLFNTWFILFPFKLKRKQFHFDDFFYKPHGWSVFFLKFSSNLRPFPRISHTQHFAGSLFVNKTRRKLLEEKTRFPNILLKFRTSSTYGWTLRTRNCLKVNFEEENKWNKTSHQGKRAFLHGRGARTNNVGCHQDWALYFVNRWLLAGTKCLSQCFSVIANR